MFNSPKKINILSSFLSGLAIFLFWGVIYPHHLLFQEQFQLFQFSFDYLIATLLIPGGFADYTGRFLTQFYYYPCIGACIITLLLLVIQISIWLYSKRVTSESPTFFYPLTFIPVLFILHFLVDENSMLSFIIALLLSLLGALTNTRFKESSHRRVFGLLLAPLLFGLVGGASFIFIVLSLLFEWTQSKKRNSGWIRYSILLLLLYVCTIFIFRNITNNPLLRIIQGINYHRYPAPNNATTTIILLVAITPFIISFLSHHLKVTRIFLFWGVFMVLIIGTGYGTIYKSLDFAKEEAFAFDYLARMRQWTDIIKRAEKKNPSSSMAMSCVNLALAKTGQLGEKMFTYPQYNGRKSLLPGYQRDMVTPVYAGEVYYHLGMINTAQRYAFEAMESIPDYQKSVRCYKRLVETNIINGNYIIAAKYIRILKRTLFYKNWAYRMERYLNDESAINNHAEFGLLRKCAFKDDFYFNNETQDIMLAFLLKSNPNNRIAFEYLMALKLIEKDLQGFLNFYTLGHEIPYLFIPKHFQEALIFTWSVNHKKLEELPWKISIQTIEQMNAFASVFNSTQSESRAQKLEKFANTFWYYLLIQNTENA